MTINNELDAVSGSWDEHSMASDRHDQTSPAEFQVAQAASTQQAAPAAAEPVPVDVGSGAPAEAPTEAKAPAAAAPHEYVADASNVVKLPANVSIDNIKVDGHNLVLEQADGSVIVIKDGALNVPTFVLGDVEVPRVALIAALEASHVDVAFGADGSMSAGPGGSTSSAGGNFEIPPGGIGDGFDLSALLPPTDLQFGQAERRELFLPNANPEFGDLTVRVSEEGLSGANPDSDPGSPFDESNLSVINGSFGATDPNGDPLTYGLGVPATTLTSHGTDVVWELVDSTHLVGRVGSDVVISVTITDASAGTFQIALLGPLDHPLAGFEDDLSIVVPVTVQDPFGGSATANMTVVVEDDSPALTVGNTAASSAVLDETNAGSPADFPIAVTSTNPIISIASNVGADGAAAGGGIAYALGLSGNAASLDSGLKTAVGDFAITLLQTNATTVTGTYQNGGTHTAFTIVINGNGTLTVTQYAPLEHTVDGSTAAAHDDVLTLSGKITASVTVTDFDGDSAFGGAQIGGAIQFHDDGPSVTVVADAGAVVSLDETQALSMAAAIDTGTIVKGEDPDVGGTGAITSGTSSGALVDVTALFGGDGPAASSATVYQLSVTNAVSGLTVTDGSTITLQTLASGVVVGVVQGGAFNGEAAFALSIDPATGKVTVEQYLSLHHSDTGNPDDTVALTAGSLAMKVTVTDSDGDTASASADVSSQISFEDDGPKVTAVAATGVTVALDETATTSTPAGIDTGAFTKGEDPDVGGTGAIAHGTSDSAFVNITALFGADGPAVSGSTVYALSVTNAVSGLAVTDGSAIQLQLLGNGVVVGVVQGGTFKGEAAFALSIDPATGKVTVEQYLSLHHSDAGNSDDTVVLGSHSVAVSVTVTDGDGDTASASADVSGQISFDDDGPSLTISQPNGALNGLFLDGFVPNGDAWGAGSGTTTGPAGAWTVTASPYEGASSIELQKVGDGYRGADSPTNSVMVDLEASPGNVQISQTLHGLSAGEYRISFEIGAANDTSLPHSARLEVIWNGTSVGTYDPTSGLMQTIALNVTATAGDNSLTFREIGEAGDNTGTFLANIKVGDIIVIDETAGVDADSDDTTDPAVAALFVGVNAGADPDMPLPQYAQGSGGVVNATALFGADGPATSNSLVYALTLASNTGVDSGLKTTDGHAISLFNDGSGRVIGVYDADNNGITATDKVAIALHLDAATGQVAVAQYVSLQHPDTSSNDEGIALGAGSVSVTVTATDGDGDHVTQSADISQTVVFEDDGPKAVGTASITANVDEDGLAGHNPDAGRPGETGAIGLSATVTGAAGALIALVDFGADGPGAQAFHLASTAVPVDSGLTSQGAHVLIVSDGNTLHGYAEAGNGAGFSDGDREVFQLTVKADGSYVFTLKDQIDHPALDSQAGDNGENQLTSPIDLSSYIVATDGDGDSISLGAGTFLIQVLDDIPVQTSATVAGNVGEDALLLANSNGHSVGNPDGDGLGTVATGSLSSLVSAGADEPGSFSLIQNPTGLPAATSKGEAIVYHVDGTVLTGYVESGTPGLDASDRKVFTLDVQPNGTYTFTLLDQIDHLPNSPANDDNQKLVLDFTHALQFTDADGDTIAITGETTTTTATTGLSLHPGHYDTYTVGGVTFDGLTFNGTLAHDFNNGAGGDSFNVSGQGVGIADNHIHDNEGFIFSRPGTDAVSFTINGNGSGTISWEAYNGAGVPISGGAGFQTGTMVMPANGSVVTIDPTGTFDHLVIRFDLDSGDKIRADDFLYTSTTTTSGGVFTIGIEDDIPVALNGSATLPTVYEDTLTTGLSTGNPDGGSQPSSITFGASAFASLVSIGADDNATFSFNVATNKTSAGVSSGGSAVHFEVGVDAVSGVSDDGRTVFTIKDNDDGTFTFTLLDQVDHAPGSGEDGTLAIDIGSLFKATDFDGDSVNLTGTLNVVVQNDTPLATTATASIMVREDNLNMAVGDGDLSTGITNGPMDTMSTHSDEATFTSAQLQLLVKPGADGPAVFVLNASPTGNVFTVNGEVVTSHGENVRLGAGPAGSVVGYVDGGTHDSVYTAGVDRVVFTLTDNGGGSFKFDLKDHLDHNIFGASGAGDDKTLTLDLTDAFSARDFDGDVAPLGNHAIQVVVENDVPVVGTSAVQLDEDGFAGGNLGGPADFDPATSGPIAVVANLNVNFGADGAGITAFLPASITLPAAGEFTLGTVSATSVFIQQHGVDVLEIDLINAATGSYTVTQLHAVDHPAAGTEDNLQFTIGYQATDFDGDTATGSFTINVNDDTPTIVAPGATVAESTAASFSNTFTPASATGSLGISWGADNANPDTGTHDRSVAFSPLLTGVQAGLTSNGDAITYTLSSDNTVLTATATHNSVIRTVFTVSINDQTNGNYSFDLRDNVDHTAPASGADKNDKALAFGFTATDSDGDSTSSFLTVHVTDDIPVVTSAAETGSVSESPLPSVQSAFGNLNIDWNADDRGASHLEFGRDAGNNLIVPLGLTSGGVDLDYSQRMAANGVDQELLAYKHGETDANPVFIVTLNGIFNPAFAFSLFQPLDHTGGSDASLPLGFTVKAVDGDGDSVTQSFTVNVADDVPTASMNAQVQLDDDALAGNPDGTGDVTPDTAHTSGTLGHTYGADGAGTTLLTGATLPAAGGFSVTSNSGTDLIISQVQNSVVVDVLKVHLADTTSGAYTVTQLHAIDHPAGGDENDVAFTVGYTTTDHDGDTVPGSLTINVDDDTPVAQNYTGAAFAEGSGSHDIGDAVTLLGIGTGADGLQGTLQGLAFTNQGTTGGTLSIDGSGHLIYTAPANVTSASTVTETFSYTVSDKDGDTVTRQVTFGVSDTGITNVAASQNLTVDEDDIVAAGGNAGGPGDDAPVTGGHISYTLGADALSSVALSVASTGLTKLDGTAVSTSWDAASHTLTGYGSSTADVVFTVTLSNITATGADYTVALNQPVSHPVHDDAATGATETAFEDNLGFTVTATVTDADNSTGTTSFTVAIDDDVPVAHNDTDSFGTGVIGSSTSGNVIDGTGTNEGLHGTGTDTLGADGARISGVTGASGTDTDVAGGGFVVSGQFGTLALQEDGSYVYTRVSGLAGSDVFTYTLKDGDGDTTTATLTVGLDSTGQPTATSSSIVVDEDDLAAGVHNTNSTGDDTTSNPENISLGSYGPDGHGALSFNVANGDAVMDGAFAVKHDGVALHYYYDPTAHTLYGTTDTSSAANAASHAAFKIEVNETAATYNFTLLQEVDHPQGGGENDINLSLGYTITDSNGDHANGAIGIKIDDDMPVAKADTVQVDEGSKPTLNAILVLDLSLSMNSDPDGAGGFTTRLALMQAAVQNFLSSSTVIFNQITIYSFGVGAELVGQYTIGEGNYIQSAINTVNGFNSNSLSAGTQYDSAANLIDGRSNNADRYANLPHPTADATNIYFLSDGDPQSGASLDANEQTSWSNFLATSHVNQVFALGFSDIANTNFLAQIASRPGDIAEAVTDPTELSSTLAGALPSSASGSILADHGLGVDAFGADGGHIQSIAIDGTTYTFNGTNAISLSGALPGAHLLANDGKSIEVTTSAGGKLTFYFADEGIHHAGDYDYTAPVNVNADKIETFHYVLVDGDGDTAGADLQITVLDIPNAAPVITAPNGGSDFTVSVPENTTAVTDINATDANGDTLTYSLLNTAGTDFAKFSINASTGLLTFLSAPNFEAPTDNGANNSYVIDVQVSDGHGGNDTQQITVNVTDVGEVTAGNDIVRTNFDGATFTVPEWALLFNDSGATDISGVSNASSLTVGNPSNTISIDDGNNADGGTFDYTATNGVSSDTASVQVSNINGGGNVTGTLANEILVGNDSANTFNGAGGVDIILAGGGNDTIIADQNDYVIDGGSGTDTLQVNGNFTSVSDAQIANVENVTLTAAAVLNLSSQTEGFVITGSSGADSITGGAGNDTIIGAQNDTLLAGGSGTDTLQIGASFNDNNDGQITGIENITLTAASTLDLSSQTEAFKIIGSSSADTITGGSANDIINGGGGNDTLSGGAGNDQFRFATNTGTDTVNSFVAGADKIGFLEGTGTGAVNFGTAGTAAGATFAAGDLVSHTTIAGIANSDDNKVILITTAQASNVTDNATGSATNSYVVVYDSNDNRAEIWFDTDWSTASSRTQVATINGLTQAQVAALTVSDFVAYNSATDPIILDLNHDGFAFSDISHGVQFDINGDGHKDQVAWNTSNDGMLAVDLNHDGKIDDGTELFTPSFGGGKFASGAAALASLDGNHDGVIDHNDAAFDSLLIWKDANTNGASDAGELSHLADNGIVSISTAASPAVGEIDGQTVTGNGTFQMADGTTGNYVEVELDTSLGAPAQPTVASDGTKTFAIGSLEVTDLIADFHDGAKGDQIDLTALLKGLAGVTDLEAGGFVEIAQSSANAANAEVKVDTNGGGDNYHTVAVLENYTFHSAAEAVKILYDDSHGTKQDVA